MDSEAIEAGGFSIGVKRNLIVVMQTELLDLHG